MLSAKLKEAAGNSADATLYVDDVFSTWLYTGNGSTQTITNGIDLAGKGGLVWTKNRTVGYDHILNDTVRGGLKTVSSNATTAQYDLTGRITSFISCGYVLDNANKTNSSTNPNVTCTFLKTP